MLFGGAACGLLVFAEDRAVEVLVLFGVHVEDDVHVGAGLVGGAGVQPCLHRLHGDLRAFLLRNPNTPVEMQQNATDFAFAAHAASRQLI